MSAFFYKGIPGYCLDGFCAVRSSTDNLSNILHLAELINTRGHCRTADYDPDFDFAIFTGDFCRALVKKRDGFFSMAIPFQLINDGETIYFNFDPAGEAVSGRFISILRNAILTAAHSFISHEEIVCSISDSFGLDISEATHYYDIFASLLADDHGYFRFDDDPDNEDGCIHPRYHFDFFYKNSSSIKLGIDKYADIECFYSLFDGKQKKHYLR
ncbi:hypothetical protein [Phytopseudomonas dryadis]|uniref:Uncharacterized protein n=1 Tax=Phytopseudomonas dryadis TaxID=2487520 RepID=A0ABY1YZ90_9GAMM|nr:MULTISPECIES: hypothetical protein [Pseudomonas]TBU98771.1 hypothetical protein DNK34_25085 [Pseudomonas dryadis]TBV11674.1 hypothetical protein DNK41_25075 [Pseudomonas sp. FRB 230]